MRLVASQEDRAAEVLARAFLDDPVFSRVFPDVADRHRSLRRLFGAVVAYGLAYGEVYTTSATNGFACWLSPGRTEYTFWRVLRTRLALPRAVLSFSRDSLGRGLAVVRCTDELHRQAIGRRPHWYLAALGVAPSCQGQGIAGSLIRPVLARSDVESVPCYLETQTERNVAFYRKRGFVVAAEGEVPAVGVRIWSMVRENWQPTGHT